MNEGMWKSWDMQSKTLMYYPQKKIKNADTCHSMSHSAVAMEAGRRLNHLFEPDKVPKFIAATWVKLYWSNSYPQSGGGAFPLSILLAIWEKPGQTAVIKSNIYNACMSQDAQASRNVRSLKGRRCEADALYGSCLWVLHLISPCLLCYLSAPQSMYSATADVPSALPFNPQFSFSHSTWFINSVPSSAFCTRATKGRFLCETCLRVDEKNRHRRRDSTSNFPPPASFTETGLSWQTFWLSTH